MGACDIGIHKGIRSVNGAVNMRFCRKVHYGIYLLILQEVLYKVIIPDIPMHEKKAGMTF